LVNLSGLCVGWWDTGHMIVAQVASDFLSKDAPNVRDAVQNAVEALVTYENKANTFVTGACWMDDIKGKGVAQFSNWHFLNIPICADNITACNSISITQTVNADDTVLWAIKQAITTIKSRSAGGFERGFALRNLLHLVGDLHQPLHAVARYSKETPNGDAGGNSFYISNVTGISNLHSLWDSGAGLFDNSLVRPMPPSNATYIKNWAETAISRFNVSEIYNGTNVTVWALESWSLAEKYVYNLTYRGTPSPDYLAAAHEVILRQIGVGGYRLAQLLRQIVVCNTATNNCPSIPVPPEENFDKTGYIVGLVVVVVALIASLFANGVFIYKAKKQSEERVSFTRYQDH